MLNRRGSVWQHAYASLTSLVASWFESAKKKLDKPPLQARPRPPFRRKVLFEALESRLLLSADPATSVNNGVLTATFTGDDDAVALELVSSVESGNGGVIVNLRYNGADHNFGDATTGITGLVINAGAGDDQITLADELFIEVTISGDA